MKFNLRYFTQWDISTSRDIEENPVGCTSQYVRLSTQLSGHNRCTTEEDSIHTGTKRTTLYKIFNHIHIDVFFVFFLNNKHTFVDIYKAVGVLKNAEK